VYQVPCSETSRIKGVPELKQGIVVATSQGRESWVREILESITAPCLVLSMPGFELGKLEWVFNNTDLDRFIFLQDSLVIRDEEMFETLFATPGSSCIMCDPGHFGSYLGLYERTTLSEVGFPICHTKEDSIRNEIEWTEKYMDVAGEISHPLGIMHNEVITVRKFRRENRVYINEFYEKWKGDWNQKTIYDAETKFALEGNSLDLIKLQLREKSMLVLNLQSQLSSLAPLAEFPRILQELQESSKSLTDSLGVWREFNPENVVEGERILCTTSHSCCQDLKLIRESEIWKSTQLIRNVLTWLRIWFAKRANDWKS